MPLLCDKGRKSVARHFPLRRNRSMALCNSSLYLFYHPKSICSSKLSVSSVSSHGLLLSPYHHQSQVQGATVSRNNQVKEMVSTLAKNKAIHPQKRRPRSKLLHAQKQQT